MTKAVAPMIGGISTPPVEAQASTPPAKAGLKPTFFIAGMVMQPVVSTFETTLSLIEPNRPDEKIATLAGPPRTLPSSAKAKLMKQATATVYFIAPPKIRNQTTSVAKPRNGCTSTPSIIQMREAAVY